MVADRINKTLNSETWIFICYLVKFNVKLW